MPYADPEIKRQKMREYHERKRNRGFCRLCGHRKENKHRQSCNACIPAYNKIVADRRYREAHKKEIGDYQRSWGQKKNRELRHAAIMVYGGYKCSCECGCPASENEFLAIDHIAGKGNQHRKTLRGHSIYAYLKRENYPEGFRVLCHNCNMAKGFYGYCPLERQQSSLIKEAELVSA